MALDHEDFNAIKRELDDRYVMQGVCNDTQERINRKLSNDDKRIEVMSHDFKTIKWLVTTVAASSIGALVVSIFEIILK